MVIYGDLRKTRRKLRRFRAATDFKGAVTLGNFSCNLSRKFVAPLRDKLLATLPSVTPLHDAGKIRCSVARIVARNKTDFYFSQRLRQQKSCKTCSFQGRLHWAIFPATKLRDKMQKRLPSVTAP